MLSLPLTISLASLGSLASLARRGAASFDVSGLRASACGRGVFRRRVLRAVFTCFCRGAGARLSLAAGSTASVDGMPARDGARLSNGAEIEIAGLRFRLIRVVDAA